MQRQQGSPAPTTADFEFTEALERRRHWWRRRGSKERGFWYEVKHRGRITKQADLDRILALVIPPAWRYVRISPSSRTRVQAVGVDGSGRVQYLYHANFVERQEKKKFAKVAAFGKMLPTLRERTNADLALEGFPKERVLAIIVRLVNDLYFRVGSEKSVKRYKTFGVTTLRNHHLKIMRGGKLLFNFIGKHHIRHRRLLVDDDLARTLRELKAIGGARLFNYIDSAGEVRPIRSQEVNAYIKRITNDCFSAKDFRTWGASVLAAVAFAEAPAPKTERERKQAVLKVIRAVAERLGNTPAICRASYIHPKLIRSFENGITIEQFRRRAERSIRGVQTNYEPEELALIKLLEA